MATPLTPLNPEGIVLGDEVYATLGEAILDGTLAPGERLRDHELAERLGVSRTPVREALQRLERVGLVEVSPNRYTRVSRTHDKLAADTVEFVAYLMGSCAHIALPRCDDETLADAVDAADAMVAASRLDDRLALADASSQFFAVICAATDNGAFRTVHSEGELAIRRGLSGWHPFIACPVSRTATYEQLRAAVAARDGIAAESLIRQLHGLR
jgi:DNA-binding GntR family transcriptional regulator